MLRPIQSDSIDKIAAALVAAQGSIKHAEKDSRNDHFGKPYTSLTAVAEACQEACRSASLAVTQHPFPITDPAGNPVLDSTGKPTGFILRTVLMHVSGQYLASELPLAPPMTDPQKIGSALTYARRYGLAAMLGVCPEDDDAESVSGPMRGGNGYQNGSRNGNGNGYRNGNGQHASNGNGHGEPRTGKALFAWVKEKEQEHEIGLLEYLSSWAKLQEFPDRMVYWDADQVGLAIAEANRKIKSIIEGDEDTYPRADRPAVEPAKPKDERPYPKLVADAAAKLTMHASKLNREILDDAVEQGLVSDEKAREASKRGSANEILLMAEVFTGNRKWVIESLRARFAGAEQEVAQSA